MPEHILSGKSVQKLTLCCPHLWSILSLRVLGSTGPNYEGLGPSADVICWTHYFEFIINNIKIKTFVFQEWDFECKHIKRLTNALESSKINIH